MKFKPYFFLFIIPFLLTNCESACTGTENEALEQKSEIEISRLPLAVGNSWVYNIKTELVNADTVINDTTMTLTVVGVTELDGVHWFEIRSDFPETSMYGSVLSGYISNQPNGIHYVPTLDLDYVNSPNLMIPQPGSHIPLYEVNTPRGEFAVNYLGNNSENLLEFELIKKRSNDIILEQIPVKRTLSNSQGFTRFESGMYGYGPNSVALVGPLIFDGKVTLDLISFTPAE